MKYITLQVFQRKQIRGISIFILTIFLTACLGSSRSQPANTSVPEFPETLSGDTVLSENQISTPSPTIKPYAAETPLPTKFSGERAFIDVERQVSMGPRIPDSPGHAEAVSYISAELTKAGWEVELQKTTYNDLNITNIIGRLDTSSKDESSLIVLGAHYDTRILSDHDPVDDNLLTPVPGGNDGASGVAVLLELARTLPRNLEHEVWLVFFDAEDNGSIDGRDWIQGSRAFVDNLDEYPDAAIIVDMIGDADLNIYYEKNSDPEISENIWKLADRLGYGEYFIAEPKYRIIDDHLPFIEVGVRAIDIIDFDYIYWHTTQDTADKVSPMSLYIVGDTLWHWLQSDLDWLVVE